MVLKRNIGTEFENIQNKCQISAQNCLEQNESSIV